MLYTYVRISWIKIGFLQLCSSEGFHNCIELVLNTTFSSPYSLCSTAPVHANAPQELNVLPAVIPNQAAGSPPTPQLVHQILCLAVPKDGFIIPFYEFVIIPRL